MDYSDISVHLDNIMSLQHFNIAKCGLCMPERSSGDVTFLYLYSGEKEYPFNLALFIFLQLIVQDWLHMGGHNRQDHHDLAGCEGHNIL